MAAGARPASPPVPAASSPPPRTRAAGSCHPGRLGADWPLPPPPPPAAASASPGAESPRAPSPRQPPLSQPGPRRRTPLAQLGGGGLRTLPPLVRREGLFRPQPPTGAQAAAPEPPPRSPEVIRGPTRAGGGGTRPTPEGGTERGQRAGRVVRGALALFPQLRTPDSGGGNCGGGEGGGVGDGSAAAALIAFIRRCLPSRRRRSMWTPLIGREGPARRGRHGPAPSPRLPPSRATRAHAAAQAPPPLRTAPRNPDRGRRAPGRARAVRAVASGWRRAEFRRVLGSIGLQPRSLTDRPQGGRGLTVGPLH
ncbi:translation initiation factor IF-2-like [Herpailurus yagouaroundi]|uniref:translation initiation factor IF-2-like n=1 Tax=Herpailurus yagouaroundi TaxID=1608482 RepID=UPI001AD68FDF|nr:translation initiation factor IF-2-like [Puma yagouaroundi]